MKRADGLNVQSCRFFQNSLHLRTVFSDDADIVTPCLIGPFFLYVQSTEFTETICSKQYFLTCFISHHDLRPMHHGSIDKMQAVLSKLQDAIICRNNALFRR